MNSQQEYKECVMVVGRGGDTVVTSGYRKSLDSRLQKLGLSIRDAATIEDEVLSLFRQYEKELLEQALKGYPIEESIKPRFKGLRQTLGLTGDDIVSIEGNVFAYFEKKGKVIKSGVEDHVTKVGLIVGAPVVGWVIGSVLFPPATLIGVGLAALTIINASGEDQSRFEVSYEDYMQARYGDNWRGR